MKIRVLSFVALGAALLTGAPVRSGLQAVPVQVSFDSLFGRGPLLEDRNGDGIVDFVNVRIVVPRAASSSDIAAAAEIGARLGYETTATDMHLVVADDEIEPASTPHPLILIGQNNKWVSSLLAENKFQPGKLLAGQGAAALVRAPFGSNDAFIIYGADEEGTLAAARALASRAPFLGKIGGPRFSTVESDVQSFLSESHISLAAVPWAKRFLADSSSETLLVSVEVPLPSQQQLEAALKAFRSLAREDQQGQGTEVLKYPGLRSLEIELSAGELRRSIRIQGAAAPMTDTVFYHSRKPSLKEIDLSNLYTIDGLFEDTNDDLIPDATDTVLILGRGSALPGVAALATRIGLESAGIRLPLTKVISQLEAVPREGHPILIETNGDLIGPLRKQAKLRAPELGAGKGMVQVVPKAVGDSAVVVVTGGDEAGLDAALDYVSQRLPHIGERGKDRPTLGDVAEEARRFLGARSASGQAASAIYKLDQIVSDLEGKDLERLEAKVFIDQASPELASFLEQRLGSKLRADELEVEVASLNIHDSVTLHEETVEFPWEVDDFWKVFREKLLPRVKSNSKVELELRVSESPEIRRKLEEQIRVELRKKARNGSFRVTVLSSHKAAFSWLTEVVAPEIKGRDIGKILVRFAELKPAAKWQLMYSKIRWLLEMYPVDEVLARDLGIPVESIDFEMKNEASPTYDVLVTDKLGNEVYRGSLDAKFVTRPFFDKFPDYDTVHVTTGWVTGSVDDEVIIDERIVTDIEKFWDHYQKETLPRVYGHIMDLYEGKPRARYAPYFGELRVDLTLSEPNFRIGIDEEIFSTLDAVHEDIYFNTITFFDVMGWMMAGEKLWHPGRILPYMRPTDKGGPGKAVIRLTGKPAGYPQVVVRFRERDGQPVERKLEIAPVDVESPRAAAVTVSHSDEGLEKLFLECKVNMERDERQALLLRALEENVDRLILSQEQAMAMVRALAELQQRGLYTEAFAYPAIRDLVFVFQVGEREATATLRSTGKKPPVKNIKALAQDYQYRGESIVQWDTPIRPEESEQIVARLDTFPEFTAYHAGRSFLGRDIWAMDVMLPVEASHWSQAKASTVKPVLLITARQHGNETSGTSHVLRLAELIATNPEYKRFLDRVNLVVHPITNPDGAAFAYELFKITPDFILHAAYLGSLGVDMTAQQWEKDPIYPEAKVRTKLWRTWLPDIFLDPHGYPKHEWIQLFAGYPAWSQARFWTRQDWHAPRGLWTSVRYVEDPRYPHHKEVALALRDYVVEGINSEPEVRAMNERMYSRYDRYGVRFAPEIYKVDYYRGVRVSQELKGSKPGSPRRTLQSLNIPVDFAERYPNVTVRFGHRIENPDETASGDWLKLVASAGFQFDLASLKYLYESTYEVKRTQVRDGDGVRFSTIRPRPARPGKRTQP